MLTSAARQAAVAHFLAPADIELEGKRPWDISVKSPRFFQRVVRQGSLGFGESYVDGEWECDRLDTLTAKALAAGLFDGKHPMKNFLHRLALKTDGLRGKKVAWEIGKRHYDLGNDLFEAMLDRRMIYSCGYWKKARTLDAAQEAKLDLVCRKLGVRPGMKVLDIGGGWGGFARFAAEKYGAEVVNVTVSKRQAEYARKLCRGLAVETRLEDFRDVQGSFDRIVSIGMFEHVGYANYKLYMKCVRQNLKDDGVFLLHTIGRDVTGVDIEPWVAKYIFPRSALPSLRQVAAAAEGRFIAEDVHNFGADYDRTLMAWFGNFERAWPRLRARYGDKFFRMWKFYLLEAAGAFRARTLQLWQIVLSPRGVPGGYSPVR